MGLYQKGGVFCRASGKGPDWLPINTKNPLALTKNMNMQSPLLSTYGIEVTEIVTETDHHSYVLGVRAAKKLRETPYPIDLSLFMEGLVDTVNGRPIIE